MEKGRLIDWITGASSGDVFVFMGEGVRVEKIGINDVFARGIVIGERDETSDRPLDIIEKPKVAIPFS